MALALSEVQLMTIIACSSAPAWLRRDRVAFLKPRPFVLGVFLRIRSVFEIIAAADPMYVVVTCKSRKQYQDIREELKRRGEDAFSFGEAAGDEDLSHFIDENHEQTEKVDTSVQKSGYRFVTSSIRGEESSRPSSTNSAGSIIIDESPGVSSFAGNVASTSEFTLGDHHVAQQHIDHEQPNERTAPSSSKQTNSSDSVNNEVPRSDGGVSAHLLMSLDDEDDDPENEMIIDEGVSEDQLESEEIFTHNVKQEVDDQIGYADIPQKAKGEVTKSTNRTVSEKCVRDGCTESVAFKLSNEWSAKCHHVLGHFGDLTYECPICAFQNSNRMIVCRHLKVAHNQGFQPLFFPAAKEKDDVVRMKDAILDCFPETQLGQLEIPAQNKEYQPSVRAVMYYYFAFPDFKKKKNGADPKRSVRTKCSNCKTCISKGPLEWKLKCEHALTHSTIPWIICVKCDEQFTSKEVYNEHAKIVHQGRTMCHTRTIEELSGEEFSELESFVYKLFPEDSDEPLEKRAKLSILRTLKQDGWTGAMSLADLGKFISHAPEVSSVPNNNSTTDRSNIITTVRRGRKRKVVDNDA